MTRSLISVFLIERTGLRKAAVVISSFGSRLFWIAVATTVGAGLSLLAGMSGAKFPKQHKQQTDLIIRVLERGREEE
jgi:bacteriorhodopsin